jgi:taurine dioxygenase
MERTTPAYAAPTADVQVRRVGVFLGAEVTGVDLSRPLDAASVAALEAALVEHEVIVLPNQKISGDDLMRFGRYFSELTVHPFSTSSKENPELIVYDNKEGNPPLSTDVWHSDETFRECPPLGTILCSKIIPELGGDTGFCSMTAAYDSLSDRMQQFVSGLEAIHDMGPFRALFPDTEEGRAKEFHFAGIYPPVSHPVVRVHPVSGRKAIFVNPQFTLRIKGMEENESRRLLDTLYSLNHRLEIQYRHRWEPDMVVFWDNRSSQHSAVHDYYPQRRMLHRVTLKGDRPRGDGPAVDPATLRKFKMPPLAQNDATRMKRHSELD